MMPPRELGTDMRRREFIGRLGGAVAAWPVVARAQQRERMRRIGLLSAQTASDAAYLVATFEKTLQESGWTDGRNVQIDYRWSAGNADNIRKNVAELLALAPDVIVVSRSASVGPMLEATRTLPSYFSIFPTRSARALSIACRTPAVTLPGSRILNTA